MGKLVLYIGVGCPYCKRVTDYLSKIPDHAVAIKNVWENEDAMHELLSMTKGRRTVPCLKMNDEYMHESLDIIEKLKILLSKK